MTAQPIAKGAADFDFFIGSWRVAHRRLKERLAGCSEWAEFGGTCVTQKILGGFGNMDDNFLDLPGGAYRAATLRSFNAATGQWSIWWLDGRHPGSLPLDYVQAGPSALGAGLFRGCGGHLGDQLVHGFHANGCCLGSPVAG